MNKTLTFLGLLGLATVSAVALTTSTGTFAALQDGGVDRSVLHEQVKTAVDAGNYSLLPIQAQEKIDQEKFADMIAKKTKMDAHRAELESIVELGDFEAFKTHSEQMRAEHEADRAEKLVEKLADASDDEKEKILERQEKMEQRKAEKGVPSDEHLQEKFDKLVSYYAENGELPEMRGHGPRRGKFFGGFGKGYIDKR